MAWERLDQNRTVLSNDEIEYLLKATAERDIYVERDKLKDEKIAILNERLSLKEQEVQLERKRADFAEGQTKKVIEISDFQAKQYQELLKAQKSNWKDNVVAGAVGVILGMVLHGIAW